VSNSRRSPPGRDREVHPAFAQHREAGRGQRVEQLDLDQRVQSPVAGNDLRHPDRRHRRQGRDRDASHAPLRQVLQAGKGRAHVMLDAAHLLGEQLALGRQRNLPGRALEQPQARHVLDAPDALAERALREMAALGRPREMLGLRQRHEGLEVAHREID